MSQQLWIAVAGLSGATSVGLAAFGRHSLPERVAGKEATKRKELWQIGNQMHMMHSLAFLGIPLLKRPFGHVAGAAFALGILGFSGSMYTKAYYGETIIDARITQTGGSLLGLGWLCFCAFPRL